MLNFPISKKGRVVLGTDENEDNKIKIHIETEDAGQSLSSLDTVVIDGGALLRVIQWPK